MVSRHTRRLIPAAVAVDLDGTLIYGNSFRKFMQYAFWTYWQEHKLRRSILLAYYVALRVCRLVTHRWMKCRVMLMVADICDEHHMSDFALSLLTDVNTDVVTELKALKKNGHPIYLATAAPAVYARFIAQKMDLDGVVATSQPDVGDIMIETRGNQKLTLLLSIIEDNGQSLWRVYTDHIDDMPLIHAAHESVLVCPDRKTYDAVKKSGVGFRLIGHVR